MSVKEYTTTVSEYRNREAGEEEAITAACIRWRMPAAAHDDPPSRRS